MRLFNTLGRQLQDFKPLKDRQVLLYTCGPTVYDYTQLGNLRSFVFDDTLRRALDFAGYEVRHVMNITDVGHLASDMDEGEDKLEKGAAREGRSVWEIADFYIKSFKQDMLELNVLPPNGYRSEEDNYARATDFIRQQVELVQELIGKGFAYQTEQAIYFDVSKLADYGELSGQKLSDKEVGARAEVISDSAKRNPQDFAVWFFLSGRFANHSMHWPSPWGEGFPGWHLECSAIIHATLGDPIDIHTGGVDHIGTHHTNEMAQTEAAYGHKLANYWLHNEFLLVDGQRMGKSLGNFYTLKDVKDRGFSPLALRLLFLQSHYRSQLNFTWQSLEAAAQNLAGLGAWADLKYQSRALPVISGAQSEKLLAEIKAGLEEDINTAKGLAAINDLVDKFAPTDELLKEIDRALGLNLAGRTDIDEAQRSLILEREQSRQTQDWQKSDAIRRRLTEQGIGINDTDGGPVWYRL